MPIDHVIVPAAVHVGGYLLATLRVLLRQDMILKPAIADNPKILVGCPWAFAYAEGPTFRSAKLSWPLSILQQYLPSAALCLSVCSASVLAR